MHGIYNGTSYHSPIHSPDRKLRQSSPIHLFPDNDSGISMKTRSRTMFSDDMPILSPGLSKTWSVTHLQESRELSPGSCASHRPLDRTLRNLQESLEESENRRCVLMHKLKEAQDTLELQSERLGKIENTARGNSVLVEDLKLKEQEYRRKIEMLQRADEEKGILKIENIRLREEMQDRIDKLDFQLRSLSAQHQVSESENHKRSNLLEQTSSTLSILEDENARLQKDRDALRNEFLMVRDALDVTKSRVEPVAEENRSLQNDLTRLQEDNVCLSRKVQDLLSQLVELRELTGSMKEENERLAGSWKSLAEEKQRASRQLESSHDNVSELKSKVASLNAERDRLFQERLDTNNKVQHLVIEKEESLKTNILLEEQVAEQDISLSKSKNISKRWDDERFKYEEEVKAAKRVSNESSLELSSVKAFYEKALEQISTMDNDKKLAVQQRDLVLQEKSRLKSEVDRLTVLADGKGKEIRRERDQLEETILDLKGEMRELRRGKSKTEDRNTELDTKLQKANEDLRDASKFRQGEIETWRNTCDQVTSASSRKETELQQLMDKCCNLDDKNAKLQEEIKSYRQDIELLREQQEDVRKLKDENRRMLQEKAENEQMIKLLETQKEVLTMSNESSLSKLHDVDQLTRRTHQLCKDNEELRTNVLELEEVRDNLVRQKEEVLANSELIYKKHNFEDLEHKIEEMRDANQQLRDINEEVNDRYSVLEQEHSVLTQAVGGDASVVPRSEMNKVLTDKRQLEDDLKQLHQEQKKLEERHQTFVMEYGPESVAARDSHELMTLRKEKEALEKQVALINGHLLLVEGSKTRVDEVVEDLQTEIGQLRQQLEEAEKRPEGTEEIMHLQIEVESLREHISKNQSDHQKQDFADEISRKPSIIRESLDDVGMELHSMRDELHKLMGVIENKDQEIVTLENLLRASKDQVDFKEKAMADLKSLMSDRETRNVDLRKSVDDIKSEDCSPRLTDESKTAEALKMTVEKGSERLQSLISKYRSYGEQNQGERKMKTLTLSSGRMGLVTKGRSFGPAAPKSSDAEDVKVSSLPEDKVDDQTTEPAHSDIGLRSDEMALAADWVSQTTTDRGDEDEKLDTEVDTQEQQDIDALIERQPSRPKPILSVRPPKITSKVIANLLKGSTCHQSEAIDDEF